MPREVLHQSSTGLIALNQNYHSFPDLAGCTESVKRQIGGLTRTPGKKVKPGHIDLLPDHARPVHSDARLDMQNRLAT